MFFENGEASSPGAGETLEGALDVSLGRGGERGEEMSDPALDAYADYLKEAVVDTRGLPEDSPHVIDTAKRIGMSVDAMNGIRQLNDRIGGEDKKTLSPEDVREIAQKTAELQPEQLDSFIETLHPELSAEERRDVVNSIKPATEKQEEDSEGGKVMKREQLERIQAEANELSDERENMFERLEGIEKLFPTASKKVQDKIDELKGTVEHFNHKLDHFLHPDEPLSTWSKRAVKLNWFIIKYMFYAILLELAIIHRMTAKSGGNRR